MLDYAYDRIERGLRMPEVLVPKKHPTDNIGAAFYTNKKLSRENKFSDALS